MDLQLDALEEAGCERIYQGKASGAAKSRPELEKCIESLRKDDALVVWRLDRFGRSLKDLVSKMETLEKRGVGFVSVTEGIGTTTAQGKLPFRVLRRLGRV
jgi:DNA invertase Pin-like site-specific DNA recombinase